MDITVLRKSFLDEFEKGDSYFKIGDYKNARTYLNKSLETYRKIDAMGFGKEINPTSVYFRLGRICEKYCEWEDASSHYRNAVEFSRQWNSKEYMLPALLGQALVNAESNKLKLARSCIERCLDIATADENVFGISLSYYANAIILTKAGELGEALESLRNGLGVLKRAKLPANTTTLLAKFSNQFAIVYKEMAVIYGSPEESSAYLQKAETCCRQSLNFLSKNSDNVIEASTCWVLGEISMSKDNYEEARSQMERAVLSAFSMVQEVNKINERKEDRDTTDLKIGIGINSGEGVTGCVGSSLLWQFTLIGDVVNVASRLHGLADNGEIMLTKSTYGLAEKTILAKTQERTGEVTDIGEISLKGQMEPVSVYRLSTLKTENVPETIKTVVDIGKDESGGGATDSIKSRERTDNGRIHGRVEFERNRQDDDKSVELEKAILT